MDAHDKAGLVLVSASGVRVAQWTRTRTEVVVERPFELEGDARELRGPAESRPRGRGDAAARRSGQQRDLHERRLEAHRERFVREVAAGAVAVAHARGWEVVVVLGDPRLGAPAAEELRRGGLRVVEDDHVLDWLTPHELAVRVAPVVERALSQNA